MQPLSAEELVGKLKSRGLRECEAYRTHARTLSIEFAGGGYRTKDFSEDSGYGLRVLSAKRMGFSYSNRETEFENTAKAALALSKLSPETDFSFEQRHKKYPNVQTVDRNFEELEEEIAVMAVEEMREGIGKLAEPARISASLSCSREEIANSNGLSAETVYTAIDLFAEAKKGMGLGFSIYSSLFLPEDFHSFGKRAGEIAIAMDGAKPILSCKMDVRFSPCMFAALLDFFLFHFDGDNKRRGITRLKKGEQRFSEKLTLISDPLARAAGACPFDAEGVPSSHNYLVNKGKVENFVYDRYTSALEGAEEKGHCQRSDYASPPTSGVSNIVIPKGDASREEIMGGDHLEIVSFHGLHTSDPVSGDFGVETDIAFLHSKGKTAPVTNVLLTGNIFNLFNSIKLMGKEQIAWGNIISPEILFSNAQIIGK